MIVIKRGESKFIMKNFAMVILTALILAGLAKIPVSLFGNVYAADDNWYVGNGVKPNMYVTYRIQNHDTNQGQPFLMTIYFKQFDNKSMYWIAPVFVVDKGKVINGTFHLSDLDLSVL